MCTNIVALNQSTVESPIAITRPLADPDPARLGFGYLTPKAIYNACYVSVDNLNARLKKELGKVMLKLTHRKQSFPLGLGPSLLCIAVRGRFILSGHSASVKKGGLRDAFPTWPVQNN